MQCRAPRPPIIRVVRTATALRRPAAPPSRPISLHRSPTSLPPPPRPALLAERPLRPRLPLLMPRVSLQPPRSLHRLVPFAHYASDVDDFAFVPDPVGAKVPPVAAAPSSRCTLVDSDGEPTAGSVRERGAADARVATDRGGGQPVQRQELCHRGPRRPRLPTARHRHRHPPPVGVAARAGCGVCVCVWAVCCVCYVYAARAGCDVCICVCVMYVSCRCLCLVSCLMSRGRRDDGRGDVRNVRAHRHAALHGLWRGA